MFRGNTEELIRRARRAYIAGQEALMVRSAVEKRNSDSLYLPCAVPKIKRNPK